MKFAFVGYHPPSPEGSAAGRQLFALGEALLVDGHEVTCQVWCPDEPADLPAWARWTPPPKAATWRVRGRALLLPRTDVARLRCHFPPDVVAVADDPASYAAVRGHPHAVTTIHFSVGLDRAALCDWSPQHLQDWRAERAAVRAGTQVWAFTERVRDAVGANLVVPPTIPLPEQAVEVIDAPVVGLLADWSWAPNRIAASALLREWPAVRAEVPGATLLLAGRGDEPVGSSAGVRWLGAVARTSDLLEQLAVFAFPCPPTSGPKMKTLDALAHGVPVLTTTGGAEGLGRDAGAVVEDGPSLVPALVALLGDPARRQQLAGQARTAIVERFAPSVAARARVAAATRLLTEPRSGV